MDDIKRKFCMNVYKEALKDAQSDDPFLYARALIDMWEHIQAQELLIAQSVHAAEVVGGRLDKMQKAIEMISLGSASE